MLRDRRGRRAARLGARSSACGVDKPMGSSAIRGSMPTPPVGQVARSIACFNASSLAVAADRSTSLVSSLAYPATQDPSLSGGIAIRTGRSLGQAFRSARLHHHRRYAPGRHGADRRRYMSLVLNSRERHTGSTRDSGGDRRPLRRSSGGPGSSTMVPKARRPSRVPSRPATAACQSCLALRSQSCSCCSGRLPLLAMPRLMM
jgi:hypothetical protein